MTCMSMGLSDSVHKNRTKTASCSMVAASCWSLLDGLCHFYSLHEGRALIWHDLLKWTCIFLQCHTSTLGRLFFSNQYLDPFPKMVAIYRGNAFFFLKESAWVPSPPDSSKCHTVDFCSIKKSSGLQFHSLENWFSGVYFLFFHSFSFCHWATRILMSWPLSSLHLSK